MDERTRFALEAAGIGEWDYDFATQTVRTSALHDRCFGYPEPVSFWNFDRMRTHVLPEDLAEVERTYLLALAGQGELDHEFRVLWADRSVHWLWARGRVFADAAGNPQRFTGILTDVTARHRAQDAANESEARMRDVIEAAPVPFLLCDTDGTIVYLNPAFQQTFGYSGREIPTHAEWWRRSHPDPRLRRRVESTWERRLNETIRTGGAFEPMEMQIRCKDGSDRSILAYAVHLAGSTPQKRLSLAVLYDVTEQRQLEHSVLEAVSFEQHRLGMDLHDGLGQQLTGLSLMLGALAQDSARASPAGLAKELAKLSEIASGCVSTARAIAHGLAPIEIGPDGFEDALRRLAGAQTALGAMAVDVKLTGFERGGPAASIAEPIYRIVQEALANAAKHGHARRAQVEVELAPDSLSVKVSDDGSGIRGDASTDGLGLRIMRYRVRALRGQIDIASPACGGTVVHCICPLPPRAEAAIHA